MSIRSLIVDALVPFTKFIGKLHAPFAHKLTTDEDMKNILSCAKPGDILLCRLRGEVTTIFIPGFFKHAVMVGFEGQAIEAVGEGVRCRRMDTLIAREDYVAVLELSFLSDEERFRMVQYAYTLCGTPYDYTFVPGVKSLYCAELITESVKHLFEPYPSPWVQKKLWGVETTLPQDFWDAKNKVAVKYLTEAARSKKACQ